jgi:hypothetical protein
MREQNYLRPLRQSAFRLPPPEPLVQHLHLFIRN